MAKMKRVTTAGPLVVEAVYPIVARADSPSVRAGKRTMSSEAQRRMNLKYAYQKLELILAANFAPGDIYATLTYDNEHLPCTRERAQSNAKAFWRKLRQARSARGQPLRYLQVHEHKHGDGRWHHHVFINATGQDYQLIRELWGKGGVEFIKIRVDRDKNFESLARYLCKEERDKVGQRLWTGSRNLVAPETESFRVPNDTELVPPDAALVFTDTGDVTTTYGHYRYIKYLASGWQGTQAPSPNRRRRHRRKKT